MEIKVGDIVRLNDTLDCLDLGDQLYWQGKLCIIEYIDVDWQECTDDNNFPIRLRRLPKGRCTFFKVDEFTVLDDIGKVIYSD